MQCDGVSACSFYFIEYSLYMLELMCELIRYFDDQIKKIINLTALFT